MRLTINNLNKKLVEINLIVYKGPGYFYFDQLSDAYKQLPTSVYSTRLDCMSFEDWLNHAGYYYK